MHRHDPRLEEANHGCNIGTVGKLSLLICEGKERQCPGLAEPDSCCGCTDKFEPIHAIGKPETGLEVFLRGSMLHKRTVDQGWSMNTGSTPCSTLLFSLSLP